MLVAVTWGSFGWIPTSDTLGCSDIVHVWQITSRSGVNSNGVWEVAWHTPPQDWDVNKLMPSSACWPNAKCQLTCTPMFTKPG